MPRAAADGCASLLSSGAVPSDCGADGCRRQRIPVARPRGVLAALAAAGLRGSDAHRAALVLEAGLDGRPLAVGETLIWDADKAGRGRLLAIVGGPLATAQAVHGPAGWTFARCGSPVSVRAVVLDLDLADGLERALERAAGRQGAALAGELRDAFAATTAAGAWGAAAGDAHMRVWLPALTRGGDGQPLGFGPLLAAELEGQDGCQQEVFAFVDADGRRGLFAASGRASSETFLRAPLVAAEIRSGFGRRRHPLLGSVRHHDGVDFAAPVGTIVWSVAAGTVDRAGWRGDLGYAVEVRHSGGWRSIYGHLSAIRVGVGDEVSQRQPLGEVGSTGLSTGPHLHYGLARGGVFLDPASAPRQPAADLTAGDQKAFAAQVELARAAMALGRQASRTRQPNA